MNQPNDSLTISSVPYLQRMSYNNTPSTTRSRLTSPGHDTLQIMAESIPASESTFVGVEGLVESQDWWLRDQSNLAVGFDNWMGGWANEDLSGVGNSNLNDISMGDLSGFFMGGNDGGKTNAVEYQDDEWYG